MSAAKSPDPAFLALRQEMAEVGADPEMLRGLAEQDAAEADAESDRLFGATLREMADARHGAGAGARLRDAILKPTRPNTPQRELQDKAWELLTARLGKLAGGGQ
jgi:hypothetical protein